MAWWSPVKAGLLIRDLLMERGPLSPSEMHRIYKEKVKEANALRPRNKKLKPMTYWSFLRLCQFARELGLIEKVGEEEIEFPMSEKPLLTIRDGKVVESKRVLYALTEKGKEDEEAWKNLRRAVRERLGWG